MKESTYRLVMITGLYLTIILFVLAIILLGKNIKEIKTDAILYGMEKHEFDSCTCFPTTGGFVEIIADDYKINKKESG